MITLHPVEGHDEARRGLARAHATEGLPSSLLFHGPRGVGKQRLALWTAQLAVCEAPGPDGPCGSCRSCRMALGLEHPDLHWYFPLPRPKGVSGDRLADALESARIEALAEIREEPLMATGGDEMRGLYLGVVQGLRRRAHLAPNMADSQTFIIGDAELLVPQESSPEAANALLKLLEEPPPRTRFILTSSEPGRLLPTIRSRSVPLHLSPLPRTSVSAFLERHGEVDADAARRAAALGQGSIGRALGFLPQSNGKPSEEDELRVRALRLVEAALAAGRSDGYAAALEQSPAGARSLVPMFSYVEEWLRDLAAVAAGREGVLNADALPRLRKLVELHRVHPSDVAGALVHAEEARELARGNVNPQLIVSGLVRRMGATLHPLRPTPS